MSNITIKDEGVGADFDWHYDLAFYYTSDHKLWRVLWDRWTLDAGGEVDQYERLAAREFYYDGARQRYLLRDVDPDTWQPLDLRHWTDYNGQMPYGDFDVEFDQYPNHTLSEQMRYLAGYGIPAQQTLDGQDDPIRYLHADLLDSTMLTSDETGSADQTLTYTAFGEPVVSDGQGGWTLGGELPPGFPRYAYAGGWGYESDVLVLQGPNTDLPPITLTHVGARWYQPSIGRFVQRDPIGLGGGLNLYLYCGANPLTFVDPIGLGPREADPPVIVGGEVLIHWYEEKTAWPFPWIKYKVYSHTQRFPLHSDDGPAVGNCTYNDINDWVKDKSKDNAEAVGEGLEKLDKEARENIKRWIKKGRKGKLKG